MGVYIDMKMPEKQICVILNPNGFVEVLDVNNVLLEEYQAIPIQQHGRLIDADILYENCALDYNYNIMATTTRINEYMQLKIDDASTVIPAEKDDT